MSPSPTGTHLGVLSAVPIAGNAPWGHGRYNFDGRDTVATSRDTSLPIASTSACFDGMTISLIVL